MSRQVVVQDIALLRADGHDIVATNRGYVLQEAPSSPACPRVWSRYAMAWNRRAMSSRASSTRAVPCST
ncbi:MAG: HTH domain-containing protein [Collinsella sp.]